MKNIALIMIMISFFVAGCAQNRSFMHNYTADPTVENNEKAMSIKTDGRSINSKEAMDKSGIKSDDDQDEFEAEVNSDYVADPIEPWNRAMFHFNDKFYFWVLKPVSKGFKKVVPRPARTGIKNFFTNITTPVRFVSCILQGKGKKAVFELTRFFINTTIGVLGFGNPAKNMPDLNPPPEDLGQTFGSYGIGNGFYIVWPFIGPSTLRDSVGLVGDAFLNPVSYVQPVEASIGVTGFKTVDKTSFHIGDYEDFKDAAIVPYEAFRDAYIQNRNKKIKE